MHINELPNGLFIYYKIFATNKFHDNDKIFKKKGIPTNKKITFFLSHTLVDTFYVVNKKTFFTYKVLIKFFFSFYMQNFETTS